MHGAATVIEPNALTIFNKLYNRLRRKNNQLRQSGCFSFQVLIYNYCRIHLKIRGKIYGRISTKCKDEVIHLESASVLLHKKEGDSNVLNLSATSKYRLKQ